MTARLPRRLFRLSVHWANRWIIRSSLRMAKLLQSMWQLGAAARFTLVAAFLVTVLAGLAHAPGVTPIASARLVALCQAGGFVLAWSVTLATSAQRHPLVLLTVSPWLIFYLVLVGGAVNGTPLAALPLLWLAWVLGRSLMGLRGALAPTASWAVASLMISYSLPGVSGLRRALGWSFPYTWLLTGITLFIAGGIVAVHRRARGDARAPGFGAVLAGSMAVCATIVVTASWINVGLTLDWIKTVTDDASAIVALLFMWTAGRFAEGAFSLTSWTLRQSARLVPSTLWTAAVLVTMAGATGQQLWATTASDPDGLTRFALATKATLGIVSMGLCAWWLRRRSLSTATLVLVTTSWFVGCSAVQGLHAYATATANSHQLPGEISGLGLMVVALGLAYEIGKRTKPDPADSGALYVPLGLTVTASTLALCLLLTSGPAWEMRKSLMILTGALHLGVPLAIARARRWIAGARPPSSLACLLFFSAGYGCALAVLAVEPRHSAALLVSVPALYLLLRLWERSQPETVPDAGALMGALFGGGLVAGWMMPYPPTLPFLPRPAWVDLLRDWGALGRPPVTLAHGLLLVVAWLTGGLLGWKRFAWQRSVTS